MKKISVAFIFLLFYGTTFAQVPQAIPYQAIIRNASGNIISNQPVKLRFSIHDSIASGSIVFSETHTLSTNGQGLVNINIGQGSVQTGAFVSINWGKNAKFIQIELDAQNNNTFIDLGTTQLMSVPYALYAKESATSSGFSHYVGEKFGGGVVFHVYKDSNNFEHGLIVSKEELGRSAWGFGDIEIPNSNNQWDGESNTNTLMSFSGSANSAASLCANYSQDGFDDWYLPSIGELCLLMENKILISKSLSDIPGANPLFFYFVNPPAPYSQSLTYFNNGEGYWSSTTFKSTNTTQYPDGSVLISYNNQTWYWDNGTEAVYDGGTPTNRFELKIVRPIRKF
jgi:hypothetical protein